MTKSRRDLGTTIKEAAFKAERRLGRLSTSRVHVGGFETVYDEGGRGSGPPVLLLHGFSADRSVWLRFARKLRGHHVVIPDLAGHGDTGFRPGAGYSGPKQAARMVELLDRLSIDRAHVIGNSMGGYIAATLARAAPDRVLSVGLVDAAGVTAKRRHRMDDLVQDGQNPFLIDDPAQFKAFYAMTMAKPPFVPAIVLNSIARDYVRRRAELTEMFADFHNTDEWLTDHLHEITAPTWVAQGLEDQLIESSTAEVWAEGIPNAVLTTYPGVGHMPMLEVPGRAAADYLEFLGGLG